jgi:hypothetical protein
MLKGHGQKLTRKMEAAIGALLSCPSIEQAAAQCGVSYRTLRKWLDLPEFVDQYRRQRRRVQEAAVNHLVRSVAAAASKLQQLLGSDNETIALRAAVEILEQARSGLEQLDVVAAIEDLTHRVREIEDARKGRGREVA